MTTARARPRRVPVFRTAVLPLALLAALSLPVLAALAARPQVDGDQKSVRGGVYSAAQAERGDKIYQARCISCHQPDQYSGYVFMQSWSGQTADSLFDLIRTTMPKDNPGSLKRQAYADLLAYIFKINGLPAGDTELKSTNTALKQVLIEAPQKENQP